MDKQLTRSAFSLPRSFKTQRSAALLPSCYSGATQLVSGAPPLSCLLSALRFSANCLFAFPSPLSLARDACYTAPRSLLSVFAAISRTPLVASASCDTCEVQASHSLRLIKSEPCGSLRPFPVADTGVSLLVGHPYRASPYPSFDTSVHSLSPGTLPRALSRAISAPQLRAGCCRKALQLTYFTG